jgi:hypothetical protein
MMSMKKSNDIIGNRTGDIPACSAVPQPTAPNLQGQFRDRDTVTKFRVYVVEGSLYLLMFLSSDLFRTTLIYGREKRLLPSSCLAVRTFACYLGCHWTGFRKVL